MKILLATDGSSHSKTMVKKFADRTFASITKVYIISVYDAILSNEYCTNGSDDGIL